MISIYDELIKEGALQVIELTAALYDELIDEIES